MFILGGNGGAIDGPNRRGERCVRDLLLESFGGPSPGDRWLALHGVHVRQLTAPTAAGRSSGVRHLCELDFLVIDRTRGFLALEVKGGELRMLRDGHWESRGGGRDWAPARNPLEQASGAMYSLLQRIEGKLGSTFSRSWIWRTPCLALPFTDRIGPSLPLDWHPDLIALASHCESAGAFERWIEGVFGYLDAHNRPNDPARAAATMQRVLDGCLLPPFRAERTARAQVARIMRQDREPLDLETPLHEFVRSKMRRTRVLVEGPAGTGKTFAAMIRIGLALRANPSARALYVCFNELLADQVREQGAPYGDRLEATSFHGLCARMARRAGLGWHPPAENPAAEEFYRSKAPELLLHALAASPLADPERPTILVIDEAQDFNEDWIATLQMMVKPDATIWCLYDPAQLLFANLAFDSGAADSATEIGARLARTIADPDILSVNYRLSTRVFDFLKARRVLPHADSKCDPLAPEGFEPEEVTVTRAEAVDRIHGIILHAIDEYGFSADQILVQAAVTPLNPEHPLRRAGASPSPDPWNVRGRYMLRPISHADAEGNPNVIDMATAQKYKGCERPFVIVIRTLSMDSARLYTACTRARLGLAVVNVES
jgi:hypothetical protein